MVELFSTVPGLNLIFVLIGIAISITAHLIGHRGLNRRQIAEVAAMYSIGIIGFQGIVNFFVHTIWADAVAASIGWPAGNPFQIEVAGANLGIGLVGFLGFWRRHFWLPFVVAKMGFTWTAGVVHVVELVHQGNTAVNNAGPILYWDFLAPLALLALVLLQREPAPAAGAMRTRPLARSLHHDATMR